MSFPLPLIPHRIPFLLSCLFAFGVVTKCVSPGFLTGTWMLGCLYSPLEAGGYMVEENTPTSSLYPISVFPHYLVWTRPLYKASGFPWRWLSWWLLRSPLFPGCTRPTWKVRRCVHMTCCWGFLSHTPLLTHPCGSHPQAAAAIRLFILTFNLWSS